MTQFSRMAMIVAAAIAAGPAMAFRSPAAAPTLPAFFSGGGGKGKRKHRSSGTYGGRSPGHRARSRYQPHQGPLECSRRAHNAARGLQSYGTVKLLHQRLAA